MRLDTGGQPQAAGEFLGQHRLGVVADDDMDFVQARIQIVEQALRVDGSTGPGHGDKDFQTVLSWHPGAVSTRRQRGD
jgi:hypothetical protein